MLELENIVKSYDNKPLLEGVSLKLGNDEIIALLGASGSGKSTLLRIIAGLEEPEAGRVLWDGQDISKLPADKRHFSLMFQDYALFPHRKVFENIAFGLRMQGLPKVEIDERVQKALKSIRMEDFATRSVTELSGGEQQRVALARALAPQPRLLLLDEPLGALDHSLRVSLLEELRQLLHEEGMPAIYVTHDRGEAFAIADRLVLLNNGKIVQAGSPQELFNRPANAWVAAFLDLGNLVPVSADPASPGKALAAFGQIRLAEHCSPETRMLLLRPQDLMISPNQTGAVNEFHAVVKDIKFSGIYNEVLLELEGQTRLYAYSLEAFQRQAQVFVSIAASEILCLPA